MTIPMRAIWKLVKARPCVNAWLKILDPSTNQFARTHKIALFRLGLGMIFFKTDHWIMPIRKPPQNISSIFSQISIVDGSAKGIAIDIQSANSFCIGFQSKNRKTLMEISILFLQGRNDQDLCHRIYTLPLLFFKRPTLQTISLSFVELSYDRHV